MSRTRLIALALVATALTVAGCGGSTKTVGATQASSVGSTQSSSPSGALTRSELIAKADPICRRVNAEISAKVYRTAASIGQLAPELASFEQAATTELRSLTPPASLAQDWHQIVADNQTRAEDTAKLGEYIRAKKQAAANSLLISTGPIQRQMLAIAARDGFNDCSRPG